MSVDFNKQQEDNFMKKFLISVLVLLAGTGVSMAALDAYNSVQAVTIQAPLAVSAVTTGAVVDVAGAKGVCNLVLTVGAAHTNAVNFGASVSLITSAVSTGTYAAVSGATLASTGNAGTGTVSAINVDASALKRYVKSVTVVSNDTTDVSAMLIYSK